jgi:hypothetical protein
MKVYSWDFLSPKKNEFLKAACCQVQIQLTRQKASFIMG